MTKQELLTKAVKEMSKEDKLIAFPPIERKNFVVRSSWYGRGQVITFNTKATKTKPSQKVTYNHDEVLEKMLPKLKLMPCWIKRGYWSQSTDMPTNVRELSKRETIEIEDIEVVLDYIDTEIKAESC